MEDQDKVSQIEFDEDGFLADPLDWSEELAARIARLDEVGELTPAHWTVIHALRAHFQKTGGLPVMRHICHINQMDWHCMIDLFGDDCREAWRIAGLPNPGEEVKAYTSGARWQARHARV